MENPRFPHSCVIYRREGASSFDPDGTVKEIYNGPCRKSSSTNIRTFNTGSNATGKVDIADYRVSIPGIVEGIRKGDLVDVTDLTGTERAMRVVTFGATTLGSHEVADESGNKRTIAGGAEIFCNTSSN